MKKPLFDAWGVVRKRLRRKNIFLFLDYDGTLTPIAPRPQQALLPSGTKSLLSVLSGFAPLKVAVVSGRSLDDIRRLVGVRGLYYAGNHGLEASGPRLVFRSGQMSQTQRVLRAIRKVLETSIRDIPGAHLEDKGFSLSYHYRLVKPKDQGRARQIFRDAVLAVCDRKKIRIVAGKKVLEVRPVTRWHKGTILAWFLEHAMFSDASRPVMPIYVGDDTTDEDAFRFLKGRGLAIRVGAARRTSAPYSLKDPAEVAVFLRRLIDLEREGF